jgi:hypothetical protein
VKAKRLEIPVGLATSAAAVLMASSHFNETKSQREERKAAGKLGLSVQEMNVKYIWVNPKVTAF